MPTNDQIVLSQVLEERKRDTAPDLTEADFFELFAVEQVLKDYDVSNDEIDEGIIGSGGDGGIDALHIFVNGELLHEDSDLTPFKGDISIAVHILQAKRVAGFSEDTIHKFRSTMENLFDLSKDLTSFAKVYNQELLSIVAKFREAHNKFAGRLPALSFHFYYVTTGTEVHPNVHRQVETLKSTIQSLFSNADFSFDFVTAKQLLTLARTSASKTYTLKLAETPISAPNSFICLVNLSDYFGFITDEHSRMRRGLFDANVRDYQGDIEVNRGIRGTLEKADGEDFWWLNNGITIIVEEATHSGKSLTIRNPQIVNGLQTSQEIYHVLQSSKQVESRNLLVRVLVPQPELEGSYQRIVRATNSQTSVSPASLRATDPFHRDIEDYLKVNKLYYERRKNYYKNEGRPWDTIISVPFLAQAAMAILLGRPNDARARPSTLLKNDQDYQKVFNSNHPVKMYLVCAQLMKKCETFLRKKGLAQKEVNNLKYYLAMFVARVASNQATPTAEQISKIDVAKLDTTFLDSCLSTVNQVYSRQGGNDQAAKGPKFVEKLKQQMDKSLYKSRLAKAKSS